MENFLNSIDWMTLLSTIWTIILIPIGRTIYKWFEAKRLDKYADILYTEVKNAVKCVYETTVKDIKNDPEKWTEEMKYEVKELAKTKAIQALSLVVYRSLKEANADFEEYLDSLIGTALYDAKHESR